MTKIIPITNFVASIIALILAATGLALAVMTTVLQIFAAFAIVTIIIGFTLAAINTGVGFLFSKSKLCIAAGIISLISLIVNISSFVILVV